MTRCGFLCSLVLLARVVAHFEALVVALVVAILDCCPLILPILRTFWLLPFRLAQIVLLHVCHSVLLLLFLIRRLLYLSINK